MTNKDYYILSSEYFGQLQEQLRNPVQVVSLGYSVTVERTRSFLGHPPTVSSARLRDIC